MKCIFRPELNILSQSPCPVPPSSFPSQPYLKSLPSNSLSLSLQGCPRTMLCQHPRPSLLTPLLKLWFGPGGLRWPGTAWTELQIMRKFRVCLRHDKSFNRISYWLVLHPSCALTVYLGLLRRASLDRPASLPHPPLRGITKITFWQKISFCVILSTQPLYKFA